MEEQRALWLEEMEAAMGTLAFEALTPMDRLKRTVALVDGFMFRLREYLKEFPLQSIEQEIYFFKQVKPEFYSWRIYAFERYGVESWIPVGDGKLQRKFLLGEVKSLERFFRLHDFHYQYFRLGASELDSLFFVRDAVSSDSVILPNVADPDPEFATRGDYLFSKFMALEKLHLWLQHQILATDGLAPVTMGQRPAGKLRWTGETINLLEVAYGLYYTGQLNDGKANIIEIVKELQEVFGTNLGRPYRRLAEIRQRKRLSRTKFIDEMAAAIAKKLDDDDEFRPS